PGVDSIAETIVHVEGVLDEAGCRVAVGPAALLLERLGQVPVVEGQPRLDALGQEFVDELRVEVEPLLVDRAAIRSHARPRGGETVGLEPHIRHGRDVFFIPVVVVAGHIAVVATHDSTGDAAEGVPDGVRAAVFVGRALDLVGRGCDAEQEVSGEVALGAGRAWGGECAALCQCGHAATAPCVIPARSCLLATTKWKINKGSTRSAPTARQTSRRSSPCAAGLHQSGNYFSRRGPRPRWSLPPPAPARGALRRGRTPRRSCTRPRCRSVARRTRRGPRR